MLTTLSVQMKTERAIWSLMLHFAIKRHLVTTAEPIKSFMKKVGECRLNVLLPVIKVHLSTISQSLVLYNDANRFHSMADTINQLSKCDLFPKTYVRPTSGCLINVQFQIECGPMLANTVYWILFYGRHSAPSFINIVIKMLKWQNVSFAFHFDRFIESKQNL